MEPKTTVIPPSVGRVVHYFRWDYTAKAHHPEPIVGLVCKVHSLRCVNLATFDETGRPGQASSVVLVQPGDALPELSYACWMEYQVGQAQKAGELQRQLDTLTRAEGHPAPAAADKAPVSGAV